MLTRRHLLAIAGASLVPLRPALAQGEAPKPRTPGGAELEFGPPEPFSWEGLVARARALREKPHVPREAPVTDLLKRIGYEQHHAIYQPVSGGLFAGPGRDGIVTAFHLSELHRDPVVLHRVEDGQARRLLYRRGYFSYPEGSAAAEMPDDAGFAGFRVHERWTDEAQPGDWLVFLGASYFRSSGDLAQYGISARGLALDVPPPPGGAEEFPDFTEFWIEEMRGGIMTIHALLQSESVTGAFRFEVAHRPATIMDVECRLFLRKPVHRLGVAPLTSMYWYSESRRWADGDWRPEIHDSDGLLVRNGGEFLWRPLANPPGRISHTRFPLRPGGGFGLIQRDRRYESYQDKAAFERRPNLWVEPKAGFEAGRVELVELPTTAEFGDNIVAFFVPDVPAEAGDDFAFAYRLEWPGDEPGTRLARLTAHRLGLPRRNAGEGRLERKVMADFVGGPLSGSDPEAAEIAIAPSRGRAFRPSVYRLPYRADLWRVEFDLFSTGAEPIDVRLGLTRDGERLAEETLIRVWPEQDAAG